MKMMKNPSYTQILCAAAISFAMLISEKSMSQCSTYSGVFPTACTNGSTITLTQGSPSPGVYFGTGVSGSTFDPVAAGAGTHQIGYSANACGDTTYQNIVVNLPPTVSLSALGPYCENADSVSLTGGSPSSGGTGYYYGTGVSSSSGKFGPTVGSGGSPYTIGYVFQATSTGCQDTATVSVVVNPLPTVGFTGSGLDTSYCEDETPAVFSITPMQTGGVFTGPGILAGPQFSIPLAGVGAHQMKYYFTDANGCTDTAYQTTNVRAKPSIMFALGTTQKQVCEQDAPFVITPVTQNPTGGYFTGNGVDSTTGVFTPINANLGQNIILYKYTDAFGCSNFAEDSINVNENPVVSLVLLQDSVCEDDPSFTLSGGVPSAPGTGVYTGTGVGPTSPYVFSPPSAGPGVHNITYEYTDLNGCASSTTQPMTVHALPTITFNVFDQHCANDDPFLLDKAVPAGGVYSGTGVVNGDTFDPAQTPGPGTYTITYEYTDPVTGCSNTEIQSLTLDSIPIIFFANGDPPLSSSSPYIIKICQGDFGYIEVFANPTAGSFDWFPNDLTISDSGAIKNGSQMKLLPTVTTTYTVTALVGNCQNSEDITVDVIPPATAEILGDTTYCFGDSTTLTATGASSYIWSTGDTTESIVINSMFSVNDISVTANSETDGNGNQCSSSDTSVNVTVHPTPFISTSFDTTIYAGDEAQLGAYGGVSYVWEAKDSSHTDDFDCKDCPDPIVSPLVDRNTEKLTYYVIGTDTNGCVNADSVDVFIDEKIIVFVPTAFSPNKDGNNDVLYVRGKGVKSIFLEIFNRRGEKVFETSKMSKGWDGTFEGNDMNAETYVYYLTVTPYADKAFKETGSITLVR